MSHYVVTDGSLIVGSGVSKADAALSVGTVRWERDGDSLQAHLKLRFSKEVQVGCSYSAEHWGDINRRELDLARCYLVPLLESWGRSFFKED